MGCYNRKCLLSGLPIVGDTEVYVFPIYGNWKEGMVYHNGSYDFLLPPIIGFYDDYGGVDNVDEEYYKEYMLFLQNEYNIKITTSEEDSIVFDDVKINRENLKKVPYGLSSNIEPNIPLKASEFVHMLDRLDIRWSCNIWADNTNTKKEFEEEEEIARANNGGTIPTHIYWDMVRRKMPSYGFDKKDNNNLNMVFIRKDILDGITMDDLKCVIFSDEYKTEDDIIAKCEYNKNKSNRLIEKYSKYNKLFVALYKANTALAHLNIHILPSVYAGQDVNIELNKKIHDISGKVIEQLSERYAWED